MKKLLKLYDLNSDMQYFEIIVESVHNGQRSQAKEQFKAMPKKDRQNFVKSITSFWDSGLSQSDKEIFIDLL